MPGSTREELEWQTRKTRIDPRLEAHGWKPAKRDAPAPLAQYHHRAVEEYPTDEGPADYAFCADGRVLAVVEAKKVTRGAQGVLTQAARYARGLRGNPFIFGEFRVPFLYSTNGELVYFQDVRHPYSRSRQVAEFHTPAALLEMLSRDFDAGCRWFAEHPNQHERLRPYQIEANAAVEQAIADRKRQMLVAMATGTGKTFTMVNQAYRLMKSGVARRILFLVDRRALAAQAVRAFASFEPEPGLKFDRIYEVYSQRFQRHDFEDDEPFLVLVYAGGRVLGSGVDRDARREAGHAALRLAQHRVAGMPCALPRCDVVTMDEVSHWNHLSISMCVSLDSPASAFPRQRG